MEGVNPEDEDHLLLERTANSFYCYKEYALQEFWKPRVYKWECLSDRQKQMIPWYKDYLKEIFDAIETNSIFYMNLLERSADVWGLKSDPESWAAPTTMDMSKTISIINQIAREWSDYCSDERMVFMNDLTDFLEKTFPSDRDNIKILIPGAGLGRLAVELVRMGFETEANEVSYHMLMVSQFILDAGLHKNQVRLHPFIHSFSHHLNRELQLQPIMIPDMNIVDEVGGKGLLSMIAGSFPDLYGPNTNIKQSESYSNSAYIREVRASNRESKDLVITNFFIDTSSNILDYLETISHVLKKGGYWINFGPFVYHFEQDSQTEMTADFDPCTGELSNIIQTPLKGLELSHDDTIKVATQHFPFELVREKTRIRSGYGTNKEDISLLGYQCSFWIMKKCI